MTGFLGIVANVPSASDRMRLDLGHDLVALLAEVRDDLRQGADRVFDHGFPLSDRTSLLEVLKNFLLLSHTCLLFPTVEFK